MRAAAVRVEAARLPRFIEGPRRGRLLVAVARLATWPSKVAGATALLRARERGSARAMAFRRCARVGRPVVDLCGHATLVPKTRLALAFH